MSSTIYLAPTTDFVSKTVSGAINDATQTITLNNTTNVTAPGVAVIDRVNSNGDATSTLREVIAFTGISGSDLTGVSRGFAGSTARSHTDGAIVEFNPTSTMWNSLATIVGTALTGDGYLKAIISPVSISIMHINTHLTVSGASVTGIIKLRPVWLLQGAISGASTNPIGVVSMPDAGNWKYFSATLVEPVSTASLVIDVNKKGTSIFAATTRMSIAAGGTYVSTASIATKAFVAGDAFWPDIDTFGGADGFAMGISIQGGSE